MVVKISSLLELGLSSYEARSYVALLKYGTMLGKDIARYSGVPATSVYRNLDSLQKKGFVQLVGTDPKQFQAVAPEIAVNAFVDQKKQDLENLEEKAIDELQQIEEGRIVEQEEILHVYSGRKQSYSLGKKLISEAEQEFLIVAQATPRAIHDLIRVQKTACKRGVNFRYIITRLTREKRPLIAMMKQIGVKVKHLPMATGFSLLVKDGIESQIAIKYKNPKERLVLHIKNKDLSMAHKDYFETLWKKAVLV